MSGISKDNDAHNPSPANNSAPIPGEEYVRWAYRLLLGREPENSDIMTRNPLKNDRQRLVETILNSEEFRVKYSGKANHGTSAVQIDPSILDYVALTGNPPVPIVAPTGIRQGSRICRQADLSTDAFRYWMCRMQVQPLIHRKLWEWFFISDALFHRNQLKVGLNGIGFGVGAEPLTALFASLGCNILATDLPADELDTDGWIRTGQHASELAALERPGVCDHDAFAVRVQFRAVDMNEIPADLDSQFDFCWSSCALEHLGSLEHGMRFIERAMALLRPGGIAVHTTEYNMTSNAETFEAPYLSIYRRQDFDAVTARLETGGHYVEPIDWDQGRGYADGYVDLPPYRTSLHLRLKIAAYACTSLGLIVHKGPYTCGS